MQEPFDLEEILRGVASTRKFLGETAATMHGKKKEQFTNLLSAIDLNVEKLKKDVPACAKHMHERFEDLKQRHEKTVVDYEEIKVKQAELEKQIAEGTLPKPEPPEELPVDLTLGRQLRNELLAKFQPTNQSRPTATGFAWQEWNLNGDWTDGIPDANDVQ